MQTKTDNQTHPRRAKIKLYTLYIMETLNGSILTQIRLLDPPISLVAFMLGSCGVYCRLYILDKDWKSLPFL